MRFLVGTVILVDEQHLIIKVSGIGGNEEKYQYALHAHYKSSAMHVRCERILTNLIGQFCRMQDGKTEDWFVQSVKR